jgi:hypothetical protein
MFIIYYRLLSLAWMDMLQQQHHWKLPTYQTTWHHFPENHNFDPQ